MADQMMMMTTLVLKMATGDVEVSEGGGAGVSEAEGDQDTPQILVDQ